MPTGLATTSLDPHSSGGPPTPASFLPWVWGPPQGPSQVPQEPAAHAPQSGLGIRELSSPGHPAARTLLTRQVALPGAQGAVLGFA